MPVRPRVGVGEAPNERTEGECLEFQRMTCHRSRATGPIFREDAIRRTGAMNDRDLTRRTFVKQSLAAVGPAMVAANALPVVSAPAEAGAARMTVVCVGAHPDDPESGCGGTLARYAARGPAEGFLPNKYVELSSVVEQKKADLFAHVSQDGQGIWRQHHEIMAQWRGREVGVPAAEAFVHLNRDNHTSNLPGL